ncbi:hypothetical protein IJG26_02680 [Candidatus Saccharibacteria bacterium]|nr:hypothetical protein [Candidatus Saccharibacteria bacterium]
MVRKGDTLIEVTLAVGIFSMIAIAVVSVMSGGTSSAQSALETTLAREEIDTQAEALRFIQSAYISDKDSSNTRYQKLWQEITSKAIELSNNTEADQQILQYTPSSCLELYNDTTGIATQNAFVINPRLLSSFSDDNVGDVYVSIAKDSSKFSQALTYPHLIYGKDESENDDQANIIETNIETNLFRAEGIYVIAVRDSGTNIASSSGLSAVPAFYDFYIRTCWYGTDAERPSTISTVIRLYDPTLTNKDKTQSQPEEPVGD